MSALAKRVTFAIAAIIVAIAMILSIVSVSTDLWITANFEGIQYQQGLWRGCAEVLSLRQCIKFHKEEIEGTITVLLYWL